jgi:VIT1/CCC1 family predicted Fe2+/Mn2+ transporter
VNETELKVNEKEIKVDETEKKGNYRVKGTLAMVFGIIGVLISLVPFARFFVVLLGIAAIVLGAIELGKIEKGTASKCARGMAISGIVLGSIAIVFTILAGVFTGMFLMHGMFGGGGFGGHMMQRFGNLKGVR